jgi:hypothetical protein
VYKAPCVGQIIGEPNYAFNTVQIVTEIESPDRSQTRAIEDSVELKDPKLTRHVRFDARYNWKCNGCSHKDECDNVLKVKLTYQKINVDGGTHTKNVV